MRMPPTFFVVALALAAPARAAEAPRPITLAEAVAFAEQNSPANVQAQGEQQTSAAGVRAAYGAFIPSLSLSAGATRQLPAAGARTRIENGQIVNLPTAPWSSNLGLGASVQLFSGGQRFFDLRAAKARATIADANVISQRYGSILAVKQRYYDVLAARESEAAARAQLDQAQQQFNSAIARVRARTATRSDSLRSEILLRSARVALLDARNAIEIAAVSLTRAVGTPFPVTAATADSLETPVLAVEDAALRQRLEDSPVVRQARSALEAAHAARQASWADYLPAATASYSRSGSGTGSGIWSDNPSYSGSLRFSVSLPVFDQFQREARRTQAQVAEATAQAALRDTRLAALETMTQSLAAFRSAAERVSSETASVESAEEDLRVQQQRYALGGSTLVDILTSQTQLDQARRDLIRARYDQRVAKAQLEALVGQDL